MKVVIDEKVKHRFVGIAVILSIGIVFAPAILKKSQRHLEESVSLSVKLPPKPPLPQVSVRESKALFQTVKVARVEVPTVDKSLLSASTTLAKAEPLSPPGSPGIPIQIDSTRETIQPALKESNPPELGQTALLDTAQPITTPEKAMDITIGAAPSIKSKPVLLQQSLKVKQKTAVKRPLAGSRRAYEVQLATFIRHGNAIALMGKLKKKGYLAHYNTVLGRNGVVYYKVVVGHAKEREQAQRLKKQLSQSVQINGFIVKKGIS